MDPHVEGMFYLLISCLGASVSSFLRWKAFIKVVFLQFWPDNKIIGEKLT